MASLYKTKLARPRGKFLVNGEAMTLREFAKDQRHGLVSVSGLVRKKVYTQVEMDKMVQNQKINIIMYKNKPYVHAAELTTLQSDKKIWWRPTDSVWFY